MLSLFAIVLLLIVPILMLIVHLIRWKYGSQWFLALLGMLLVWPVIFITRQYIPQFISYISWEPKSIFPISPTLLIDDVSWVFSMALATIGVALVLTAVARIEHSDQSSENQLNDGFKRKSIRIAFANWQIWASSLIIIGLGLVAVKAGNLLTILLAWAIIDTVELLVLLTQVHESPGRERAVIAYAFQAAAISILIFAEIQVWHVGGILSLSSTSSNIAIYLLIAAVLHLGVLPIHLPFQQEIPLRRGLGTILRLVPLAASLSLLARVGSTRIESPTALYLILISALIAIYGAVQWVSSSDEMAGRPFWILGTASMATSAALASRLDSSLAWGSASLFVGGLLFFSSLRHQRLIILTIVGFLGLSGLPFTPNWAGVQFYNQLSIIAPSWVIIFLYITFMASHALLLAGFLRHSLRPTLLEGDTSRDPQVERWIWLVYPLGLAILPITHFITGFFTLPDYQTVPVFGHLNGLVVSTLGIGIWYIIHCSLTAGTFKPAPLSDKLSAGLLSFSWLYRLISYTYKLIYRLSSLIYGLLEGDGGILWAIALFFFILMFFQR
jgi:hypothetical protein